MVTSYFRTEVEIRPFRACAIKNINIALIYGRIAEIFASFRKSGNTAGSHMRNASGYNYWSSSFIMDVAVGQISQNAFLVSRVYGFKKRKTYKRIYV